MGRWAGVWIDGSAGYPGPAMTDREQLAAALAGLDPRDREILDYSLGRRVPDEDLAELFGGSAGDIARLRAAAVERLSKELDIHRGADLGQLLRELLQPATWTGVITQDEGADSPPHEAQPDEAQPDETSVSDHGPVGVIVAAQKSDGPASPSPGAPLASPDPDPDARPAPAGGYDLPESQEAPVLGMLSRVGDGDASPRRRSGRWLSVALALAVAVLVPAGMFAALTWSDDNEAAGLRTPDFTRTFEPEGGGVRQPFPSEPESTYRYPVAYVDRVTELYEKPESPKVKARLAKQTDWGTPRALSVVRRDGPWLAVLAPELRNGQVGWIHEDRVERLTSVEWSVHVDLSKREVVVRRNGKLVRRLDAGVGRKGHSTPVGRYAVTDKLKVKDRDSPYGCCVIALTGHQNRLPAGWPGGDRLAVHATRDVNGLGRAVSLGCVRTDPRDTRWMMRVLPLGSAVFIKA